MKRAGLLLTAVLLSSHPALAQSGAAQQAWDDTVAAAKREGKVVVMGPPDSQVRKLLPEAFKARFGITMEYVTGRGTDTSNKLRAERAAGVYTADAVIAGIQTMSTVLYREKMLEPLRPQLALPDVIDGSKWKKGKLWFSDPEDQYVLRLFSTVHEAFMINTEAVKLSDLHAVRELVEPKWKGKISFLDPTLSGTGSNQAALLYTLFGEDFAKKIFIDQKPIISRERHQLTDWLLRGTYPITFGAEDGEMERLRSEGLPVQAVYGLPDMPGSLSGGNLLAMFNHPPHPNAAKVFVNWMASREGNEIFGRALKYSPTRNDTDEANFLPPETIPKPGVNYFDTYDWEFTVTTKEEVRRRMKELLRPQ
jgi:iron(III) transport system substrate-binding protein